MNDMAMNLPGGVSIVWALIYMALGLFVVPMILGLVKRPAKSEK